MLMVLPKPPASDMQAPGIVLLCAKEHFFGCEPGWTLQRGVQLISGSCDSGRVCAVPVCLLLMTAEGAMSSCCPEPGCTQRTRAEENPPASLPRETVTFQIKAAWSQRVVLNRNTMLGQITALGELEEATAFGSCGVAADSL